MICVEGNISQYKFGKLTTTFNPTSLGAPSFYCGEDKPLLSMNVHTVEARS